MGQYNFVSPGAAMGDAVSRYFAELDERRRRDRIEQDAKLLSDRREERLSRHEEAAIANQAAIIRNTEENTQSLIEAREQAAAATAQQQFVGSHMPGDEVGPDAASQFPGLVASSPLVQGAQIGEAEEGVPLYDVTGGTHTFRGDAKQREELRKREQRTAHIATLDPTSPQAQFLAAQDATGDTSLPFQMFQDPKDTTTEGTLQQQANRANAAGNTTEYNRILGVIKATGQADDRPSAGNTTINMGTGAIDDAALRYNQTWTMPALGMGNGSLRTQILNRAAELRGDSNPAVNAAAYGADKGALNQITKSLSAITAFEETAQKNIEQMKTAMQGVTDTGIPLINAPIRDLQRMAGSPEVAKYQASIRVVIPELARILTQPNLAGQLTDQARHEIESVVRGDATVAQANAVIDLLLADMTNRKTSLTAQRDALMSGIAQRGPAGTPGVVAPGPAPSAPTETPEQRRARLRGYLPQQR